MRNWQMTEKKVSDSSLNQGRGHILFYLIQVAFHFKLFEMPSPVFY